MSNVPSDLASTANLRQGADAIAHLPARVGPYRVLRELGRGGMGLVMLGIDDRLHRLAAIKTVLRSRADAEGLYRFRLEAEAVARLDHPNIVHIYDVGDNDGVPYLALEYLDGGSLADRLNGPGVPRDAAVLMRTLAEAVHHAHQKGIIHRDLKPSNVLFAADGSPRITDFGIAKMVESEAGHTRTGDVIGTPQYMAPEQASGQAGQVGTATDVYALGAILHELLVGEPPFEGMSLNDVLVSVLYKEVRFSTAARRVVPRDLETICLKCLEKEPTRRYASAAALADDLRRYLAGEPILARPVGVFERLLKYSRRYPVVTGLAASLLLTFAVGFVAVLLSWREAQQLAHAEKVASNEAREARKQAERREARLASSRGQSLCEQGEPRLGLLWLARALQRASAAGDEAMERPLRVNLAAWQLQLSEPLHTLDHPQFVQRLVFMPDGKQVVTVGRDGKVRFWDAATGKQRPGTLDHPSYLGYSYQVVALAVSPDGKLVATGGSQHVIRLWDIDSCKIVGTLPTPGHTFDLAFSPDGKKLVAGTEKGLRLWDVATRSPGVALDDSLPEQARGRHIIRVVWHPGGKWLAVAPFNTHVIFQPGLSPEHSKPMINQDASGVALAFDRSGERLAVGCHDGSIRLWEPFTARPIAMPIWHGKDVRAVAVSPDGRRLLSGSDDGQVRLWSMADGRPVSEAFRLGAGVLDVAFSPSGDQLAYGGLSGQAHLRTAPPSPLARPPRLLDFPALAFLPRKGGDVVVATWYNAQLYDVGRDQFRPVEIRHGEQRRRLTAVALSAAGDRLATGGKDNRARVWSLPDGRELWGYDTLRAPSGIAFHPDGQRIVVTIEEVAERMAFHQPGGWLCDTRQPAPLAELFPRGTSPSAIQFTPEGRLLVGRRDGSAGFADLVTGALEEPALATTDAVEAVAMSPDGRLVLTGSRNGRAQLWDAVTGRPAAPPMYHQAAVTAVAFAEEGRVVLTASVDRRARLWDVATGLSLGPPLSHREPVTAALPLPDGQVLTGGIDANASLWKSLPPPMGGEPGEIVRRIERLTGMRLDEEGK